MYLSRCEYIWKLCMLILGQYFVVEFHSSPDIPCNRQNLLTFLTQHKGRVLVVLHILYACPSNFWTKQPILNKLHTNAMPSIAKYFHTYFFILHNYECDHESWSGSNFGTISCKMLKFFTYLPLYKYANSDTNISMYNVT